jgi:hypothetical protein
VLNCLDRGQWMLTGNSLCYCSQRVLAVMRWPQYKVGVKISTRGIVHIRMQMSYVSYALSMMGKSALLLVELGWCKLTQWAFQLRSRTGCSPRHPLNHGRKACTQGIDMDPLKMEVLIECPFSNRVVEKHRYGWGKRQLDSVTRQHAVTKWVAPHWSETWLTLLSPGTSCVVLCE